MARSAVEGIGVYASADVSEFVQYLNDFERQVVPAAIVSSLTSTGRAARKVARKQIESVVGMTSAESAKRLRISRATPTNFSVWLFLNRKDVVLAESRSGAKTDPYKQARVGKRGRARYSRHSWDRAFRARVDGRAYVFERGSFGIRVARFPMVPQGESILQRTIDQFAGRYFEQLLASRIQRYLDRRGSGRASTFFSNLDISEAA